MTEERFDELINLYLDNEIGRSDLGELKHAISSNLVRRRKFERACQLHQAARKALTAPASGERNENRAAGASSEKTGNGHPAAHKPSSANLREFAKSKQRQARRNASVTVLAERQERQGAASAVELGRINLELRSGRHSHGTGGSHKYGFFDSPLGMVVAFVLIAVGCLGMYFFLHIRSPGTQEDPDKFSGTSPLSQLDGGYGPKAAAELAAEIKKRKTAPIAADAMRARLYQSALTGQASSNETTIDYFSSHLDQIPADGNSQNTGSVTPLPAEPATTADESVPQGTGTASAPQP